MNAESCIRDALLAALRGDAALMERVNRVYDGPPARFTPPALVLGEALGTDWGTKDRPGRDISIGVTIDDDAETPARINAIMPLVEGAVLGLIGPVEGWQIGSLRPVRSRLLRTKAGRWNAVMDYRIKVLAE